MNQVQRFSRGISGLVVEYIVANSISYCGKEPFASACNFTILGPSW